MLSFPAANRDPAMFPDADKVIIDRKENRHAAFGLGIHRCVGSNLARMEMTVAVEEFLKRIPEFSLAGEVTWSGGRPRPAQAAARVRVTRRCTRACPHDPWHNEFDLQFLCRRPSFLAGRCYAKPASPSATAPATATPETWRMPQGGKIASCRSG